MELESLENACPDTAVEEKVLPNYPYKWIDPEKLVKACPLTDCSSSENASGRCDPKVFIAWKGTDKNGTSLISSSSRLTYFDEFGIKQLYESLLTVNTNTNDNPDSPIRYDPKTINADIKARLDDPSAIIIEETGVDPNAPSEGDETTGEGDGTNNGDTNNGDTNNDDTNNDDTNNGDANNGDANNGDANNGDANNGDANNGDANNGDANNGDANNGDANNEGDQSARTSSDNTNLLGTQDNSAEANSD